MLADRGLKGSSGASCGHLWGPSGAIGGALGVLGSLVLVCGVVWPPDGGMGSPKGPSARNLWDPEVDFDR